MAGQLRPLFLLAIAIGGLLPALPLQAAETVASQLQQLLQAPAEGRVETSPAPAGFTALVTPAVARFYQQREWAPVWNDARFAALLQEIRQLQGDGLNPDDYFLPELETYQHTGKDSQRRTERELLATRACLLALRHLYRGKTNPAQLDPHWNFSIPAMDTGGGLQELNTLLENNQLATAFRMARPAVPAYDKMRTALADMRELAASGGWPTLPEGPLLKPGMRDARVPLLRQRLAIAGLYQAPANLGADANLYDSALEEAVKRYQQASNIDADGKIGADTLQQLNISAQVRVGQLRVNLERMRWHLNELQDDYVMVDVAGYRIAYVRHGEKIWQSRVQVGRAVRKTPIFQSNIAYLTLNPRWKVPPTIFRKDSLPAIRKNIGYLAKNHLHVYNAQGQRISAASVNWNAPGNITLIQDARPDGALGQLAIRFPNDYSVYLHETPHQALFSKELRAFSSGCIRVENVRELGVLLLNDDENWNRGALETAIAEGKTRNVSLKKKIPILLAYWTADIDAEGHVTFRPDIYGYDPLVLQALDGINPGTVPAGATTGNTE